MDKKAIEEMKRLTANSTERQVAVLMADPEGLEHPAEAILGVYNNPPDAFDRIDKQDIEGGSVLVTTFHRETCNWLWSPMTDHYETECGEGFQFTNGGVEENNYQFCPHCGRKIEEIENE